MGRQHSKKIRNHKNEPKISSVESRKEKKVSAEKTPTKNPNNNNLKTAEEKQKRKKILELKEQEKGQAKPKQEKNTRTLNKIEPKISSVESRKEKKVSAEK